MSYYEIKLGDTGIAKVHESGSVTIRAGGMCVLLYPDEMRALVIGLVSNTKDCASDDEFIYDLHRAIERRMGSCG